MQNTNAIIANAPNIANIGFPQIALHKNPIKLYPPIHHTISSNASIASLIESVAFSKNSIDDSIRS